MSAAPLTLGATVAAALGAVALLALLPAAPARAGDEGPSGELRLSETARRDAARGPLAAADALAPGIAPAPPGERRVELELRHTLRARPGGVPVALAADVLLRLRHPDAAASRGEAQVNELNLAADHGSWQFSAGRKVLGWDVGYAFRPNDVVQQEVRRTLLAVTPQGRPLLQAETIDADSAHAIVWVNPQRLNADAAASRGADESALAWRGYRRLGSLDAFGFARVGAHTGASVGAALAWVAGDELELHASARLLQRHDGWRIDPAAGDDPRVANPWSQATRGGAAIWLVGANWTGAAQQSVLVEAWHDGSALPDSEWDRWRQRNAVLASGPAPALARAGNLAWQATPLEAPSLRQDNLFVRLAWQPERWSLSLDALVTPADRGRIVTAGLQWQGERWRVNAAWRTTGGPADSVLAQLPTRRTMLLAATRPF